MNPQQDDILNSTIKDFSENEKFRKFSESLFSNIVDINHYENNKTNDENTNILNMYLLDEQGNSVCDLLNKINMNLSKLVELLSE